MQLRSLLHRARFRLDHWCGCPLPGGDVAVALRWSMAGVHGGVGVWGAPTGRDILVLAVSHYRLRAGAIVEDCTVFDELAVLRQVAGGLGQTQGACDDPRTFGVEVGDHFSAKGQRISRAPTRRLGRPSSAR